MRHDGPPPKPLCGSLQPCSSVLLPRASPPSKVGSCATARGAASSARETTELDKRPKGDRDGSDSIVAARYSDSDPHSPGALASLGSCTQAQGSLALQAPRSVTVPVEGSGSRVLLMALREHA